MNQGLDEGQRKVIERVAKLLTLAANNPNEEEAAAAHSKAQEMLIAYNLDMSAVNDINNSGVRQQEAIEGGKHEWQQQLWDAVADLNFCGYFNTQNFIESTLYRTYEMRYRDGRYQRIYGTFINRHNLIGRVVNIAATRTMAQYLEEVCNRIVKEACKNTNERPSGRWAKNYCDGLVTRVVFKIYARRRELLTEEKQREMEALKKAAEFNVAGVSTSTAMTLAKYSESEEAANYDFRYGDGAWQKLADERARKAQLDREADEAYTKWAEANPEKARKEEEKRRKAAEKREQSDDKYWRRQMDKPGYAEGYRAGESVSIDQQADHQKAKAMLK